MELGVGSALSQSLADLPVDRGSYCSHRLADETGHVAELGALVGGQRGYQGSDSYVDEEALDAVQGYFHDSDSQAGGDLGDSGSWTRHP